MSIIIFFYTKRLAFISIIYLNTAWRAIHAYSFEYCFPNQISRRHLSSNISNLYEMCYPGKKILRSIFGKHIRQKSLLTLFVFLCIYMRDVTYNITNSSKYRLFMLRDYATKHVWVRVDSGCTSFLMSLKYRKDDYTGWWQTYYGKGHLFKLVISEDTWHSQSFVKPLAVELSLPVLTT